MGDRTPSDHLAISAAQPVVAPAGIAGAAAAV